MSGKYSMRKSRILMLDNNGLSHYTCYLAKGLSLYHDIILYGFSKYDFELTGASKEKTIEFHFLAREMPTYLAVFFRPLLLFLILFIALIREQYDIVHLQGPLPMFFLFVPMLKIKKKAICWTMHDIEIRPSNSGLLGRLELLYVDILVQPSFLCNYVDAIIVHGSFLKDELCSKNVCSSKIHVMPHFDYRYLLNLKPYDLLGYNAMFRDYVLLFGRILPYKGIEVLIKALRSVRESIDIHILIAGRGNVSYISSLLTEDERNNIFIRNEWIPSEEIPELFKRAKFLVLPYTSASQSGIIPLSYTFAKPVIVSSVGSLREFVDHGETGFIFDVNNNMQLVHYITKLLEDDQLCIEMGMKANKKLLREMSLESSCRIMNSIYHGLSPIK